MRKNQADAQPEKADNTEIEDKNRRLAILAARVMDEQRAEDVLILDLRTLIDYADYFVIGSASSMTRMRGIVRRVEQVLAKNGGKRLNQPDKDTAWALADFGDVLVHVFDATAREFYQLEDLWLDAPQVEWREGKEDAAPAPAVRRTVKTTRKPAAAKTKTAGTGRTTRGGKKA